MEKVQKELEKTNSDCTIKVIDVKSLHNYESKSLITEMEEMVAYGKDSR